jgi:hypothetical protein
MRKIPAEKNSQLCSTNDREHDEAILGNISGFPSDYKPLDRSHPLYKYFKQEEDNR